MLAFFNNIIDDNERDLRRLAPQVQRVNAWEQALQALPDQELRAKTDEFRARLGAGETLADLLPEAFAVVREAPRTLATPFDGHQGSIVLHQGRTPR